MVIFPDSQMGICPFCGHQYVECYISNTYGNAFIDQRCFSCGRVFTVERNGRGTVYKCDNCGAWREFAERFCLTCEDDSLRRDLTADERQVARSQFGETVIAQYNQDGELQGERHYGRVLSDEEIAEELNMMNLADEYMEELEELEEGEDPGPGENVIQLEVRSARFVKPEHKVD